MRMRLPAAEVSRTDVRRAPVPRAPLHVEQQPASFRRDPQIGQIFCNMRGAARLSREALARHLATTPGVIEDLESGALQSLPHWRETSRIVCSYCEILRLDPQPILWHIQKQLEASAGHVTPPTRTAHTQPPGPPPVLRRERGQSAEPARKRRRARTMFALSAPLLAAAAALYIAQAAPGPVYRSIALLPGPIADAARAGMDSLVLYSAPLRDGLRWVDVGDPQLRKVDKLRTTGQ